MHLSKPFANPAEMKEILAEINGPGGPLGRSTDHQQGLGSDDLDARGQPRSDRRDRRFVDPDLAAAFGTSRPLEQLVDESGVPVEQGLNLTVTVQMPHQKDGLTVRVPLDGREVPIQVETADVHQRARWSAIIAGICGALFAGWLAYWATRAVLRIGRRRDPFTST